MDELIKQTKLLIKEGPVYLEFSKFPKTENQQIGYCIEIRENNTQLGITFLAWEVDTLKRLRDELTKAIKELDKQ